LIGCLSCFQLSEKSEEARRVEVHLERLQAQAVQDRNTALTYQHQFETEKRNVREAIDKYDTF